MCRIYIDICQVRSNLYLRNSDDDIDERGHDLTTNFPYLYSHYTPRPGISIGCKENHITGSLTGFLKHNNDIYSLTCRHVIFPAAVSQSQEYQYKPEEEKVQICMPATDDHEKTKKRLESQVREATGSLKQFHTQ